MLSSRWEKIESIFSEAIALPEEERFAFVEKKCDGDEELCAELIRLLEQDGRENLLLDTPVFDVGARILAEDETLPLDKDFAFYRLQKRLGTGGMGVVYLAEDTRLNRLVALKVLPASLAELTGTVQRFRQEARAASNVVHQNVAHIYEFGEFNNRFYLTMEYVAGRSLRAMIKEDLLDQKKAVEIALQIAAGLQAAHAKGIVHRDVKPENVVVTEDGTVKVLDFGLAKSFLPPDSEGFSLLDSLATNPGLIMGTVAYMSPEQIRGHAVDQRADVWSLGVVLYEMLGGRRPFEGDSPPDIMAVILKESYAPLAPALEKKFGGIFERSLAKEPEQRFQNIGEFIDSLKQIKFENGNGDPPATQTSSHPIAHTGGTTSAKTTEANFAANTQTFVRKPQSFALAALILLSIAATASWMFYRWRGDSQQQAAAENSKRKFRLSRLTGSGNVQQAAISSDGSLVVYASEVQAGKEGLYLRQASSSEFRTLIEPGALEFSGIAFSPDGRDVFYSVKPSDEVIATLFRIENVRDANRKIEPQKILTDIDSAPGFSPDGRQFVFLRLSPDGTHEDLLIADADGKNEKLLISKKPPEFMTFESQPAWSPDGKTIAFAAGLNDSGERKMQVAGVNLADNSVFPITNPDFAKVSQVAWHSRGDRILAVARKTVSAENEQIFSVNYPGGEAEALTNDINDYSGISVSADASRIVTLAPERIARVWLTDLSDETIEPQIISAGSDDGFGVSWLNNDQIIYGSNASGNADVWICEKDGSGARQLTMDSGMDTAPSASADGKTIVFESNRSGNDHVWAMNSDGSNQRQLTDARREWLSQIAPDGKSVVYYSYNAGVGTLSQTFLENGQTRVLTTKAIGAGAIAPDGKLFAFAFRPEGEKTNHIAVANLDAPEKILKVIKPVSGATVSAFFRWTPDGQALGYPVSRAGATNVWLHPLDEKQAPRQITNFSSERIFSFAWSPDGRKIACSRGQVNSFVTLMQSE
jgi:serine/threonine protein kinase/Tol biopolymer transport system component